MAEKTGYDVEELEPDFELEADLGIDTVKQAEIFSDLREQFAIADAIEFEMTEAPTIQSLIDWFGQHAMLDTNELPMPNEPEHESVSETKEEQSPSESWKPHLFTTRWVPTPISQEQPIAKKEDPSQQRSEYSV